MAPGCQSRVLGGIKGGERKSADPEPRTCCLGEHPRPGFCSTACPQCRVPELQSRLSPSHHWVKVAIGQVSQSCNQFWDRGVSVPTRACHFCMGRTSWLSQSSLSTPTGSHFALRKQAHGQGLLLTLVPGILAWGSIFSLEGKTGRCEGRLHTDTSTSTAGWGRTSIPTSAQGTEKGMEEAAILTAYNQEGR